MSEPDVIVLNDDVSEDCIEQWKQHWLIEARRERPDATTTAEKCRTINRICELAKEAVRMKRGSRKRAKSIAVEMLRQMADQLEG